MRLLIQLLALYLGNLPVCAQTVGATNLLTRGPGAEAAALGNTVVSTVHDPTALYWNPAGLARAGGMVTGEHLFLYDGARYDFVGLSVPSALGTFGLAALQLNRDNIVARNAIDDPGTNVSNTQSDYMVGFARMLGEHFAAGGTAGVYEADLHSSDAAAALVERIVTDRGRLDVVVNNAGIIRDGLLFTMSDDDLDAVLDALNLPDVHYCGESLGGIIGSVYAAERPRRVRLHRLAAIGHGDHAHALAVAAAHLRGLGV